LQKGKTLKWLLCSHITCHTTAHFYKVYYHRLSRTTVNPSARSHNHNTVTANCTQL